MSFFNSEVFSLIVIPILIFCSRILDVTFGTIRIIFVSRGMRFLAALLGFFEVLIWIVAISQIMRNLTTWYTYVAYALGFATGNFIGISIERRIALGNLIVRIITREEAEELVKELWNSGYGVTSMDARGETGPVKIIFTVVKRRKLPDVIAIIKRNHPQAFYTVEDVRFVAERYTPLPMDRREVFSLKSSKK
jgi:uncharacterized protein YebE (UPF0316 family)